MLTNILFNFKIDEAVRNRWRGKLKFGGRGGRGGGEG